MLWHEWLGHLRSFMMHRIISNSHEHPLKNQKIFVLDDYNHVTYSQGKLIIKPSFTKVLSESSTFIERIHGDICGLIYPFYWPFWYFMVLIDVFTRLSHVDLFSTRNVTFARLLAQIICLRAQFPNYLIKKIRLDNASEFLSQTFVDFVCQLELTLSTQLLIFIPKWSNWIFYQVTSIDCLTITFKNTIAFFCLGSCYTPCCCPNPS